MKSPDVNSGDQAIGDRQSKHIARDESGADYEGGRRDHREGVREHPNSPVRAPKLAMHWAVPCINNLAKKRVRSSAQVKEAPDDGTCTTGCEPRVQVCNCQERESNQVYKSSQRTF